MPPQDRKTRADAERNRVRVLEVARELAAEHGEELQMTDVAKAAGVGVGTIYRHFPTRRALLEAAAEQRFREILDYGETTCLSMTDTRRALSCFLHHIGEVHEQGRALSGQIEATLGDTAPRGEISGKLRDLGGRLLERGSTDGTIRADATVADLYMIVGALSTVARHGIGDWRRFIELALDGLLPRQSHG
ncbi:MAG: TetR/AcrR family transcriptional regulator [Stackebrandtia sp.]